MKETKKDIFDLLKSLEDKSQQVNDLFGCGDFLDEEVSIIWAIIEDSYGIEGMDTDQGADILSAYGAGEISKKQAQKRLRVLTPKITK